MEQPIPTTHTSTAAAPSRLVGMSTIELAHVLLRGLIVGLLAVGVALIFNKFVFSAILCRPGMTGCSQAPLYATVVSVAISSIVGVLLLARLRVYRPLLVVIATVVALWAVFGWLFAMPWYLAFVVGGGLFALSYGVFSWILRIRSLLLAGVFLLTLIALIRFVAA